MDNNASTSRSVGVYFRFPQTALTYYNITIVLPLARRRRLPVAHARTHTNTLADRYNNNYYYNVVTNYYIKQNGGGDDYRTIVIIYDVKIYY